MKEITGTVHNRIELKDGRILTSTHNGFTKYVQRKAGANYERIGDKYWAKALNHRKKVYS